MQYKKKKRNTPIATLIKDYVNKKSGKVAISREEIQWRFNYLDWKDQKKILMAFLESGKTDREWIYCKLLDLWDEMFLPKVKELWETYHEYKCSWLVIRYFPLEYVTEHMDEFTDERDYYFICLRLAMNKKYVIDRSKLSTTDYLSLLYHTNRGISLPDALDCLFRIVHDCCLDDTYITKLVHLGRGKYHNVISPANFYKVDLAFYYILKLQQYEALMLFKRWNEEVEESIFNSPEFKDIEENNLSSGFEYDRRRIQVASIYAFQALDDKYKLPSDPSVEDMREAYQKGIEWSRMYREQSAEGIPISALDFIGANPDDEDPLPF